MADNPLDRDQLTEALAEYDRGEGRMLDGWATEILVIVEVARRARDFPTDEMVEAHDAELRRLIPGVKGLIYRRASELMLEAVRRVMIGEEA